MRFLSLQLSQTESRFASDQGRFAVCANQSAVFDFPATVLVAFGICSSVRKARPRLHLRHSRTRSLNTNTNPNFKNGLHCLLFHRLRRGPQGVQGPGEFTPRATRPSRFTAEHSAICQIPASEPNPTPENARLTTTRPSFPPSPGQVCVQGHQG